MEDFIDFGAPRVLAKDQQDVWLGSTKLRSVERVDADP